MLALALAGTALYLVLREELVPEPITFQYGDQTLVAMEGMPLNPYDREDRKSTRLNSSHVSISYAVFCLKKKKRRKEKYS